jgi:hypothetical protein
VLIALLAAGAAAHAQIHRWVDERGVVHYGERPPSGTASRPVEDRMATPAPAPKSGADSAQQEREFQQRRIDRERREKQAQQQAAQAKAQCERERRRLAQLREARRVFVGVDEKGERRYMDDAERAAAVERQEAVVAQRCA